MIFYSSNQFGRRNVRFSSGGGIGCLIFGVLGLAAAYFLLKGLFTLLYWISPALFVLALVINWRAVVDTLKNWLKGMETNPVGGLLTAALAVLLFPVFALYLFVKALGYNKIQQIQREFGQTNQTREDDFVEFEELESTPKGGVKADEIEEPPFLLEKEPEATQKTKRKTQKSPGQHQESTSEQSRPAEPKKPENPYDELFN